MCGWRGWGGVEGVSKVDFDGVEVSGEVSGLTELLAENLCWTLSEYNNLAFLTSLLNLYFASL